MIQAPAHRDQTLLEAFRRLPRVGFLAAALVDHDKDHRFEWFRPQEER